MASPCDFQGSSRRAVLKSLLAVSVSSAFNVEGAIGQQQSNTVLTWRPPETRKLLKFKLPIAKQDQPPNVNEDTDLQLLAPDDSTSYDSVVRRANVLIYYGGKKIWSDGTASAAERFYGIRNTIFREGGHIIALKTGDGMIAGGEKKGTSGPNVYLQNMLIEGVNGSFDSVHADGYQHQFAVNDICFDKITIRTGYQGLFLSPQYPVHGRIFVKRTNIVMNANPKAETSVAIWLFDSEAQYNNSKHPVYLDDVWVKPRPGSNKEKIAFAAKYGQVGQDEISEFVWFGDRSRIQDLKGNPAKIRIADASFIDFVQPDEVGIRYDQKRVGLTYTGDPWVTKK